jgi:hypothetical protein
MYYNYKCPVTVEGLSNIDLSQTAQDITQYPFQNTRYAPYGQVNGRFDDMVSQKLAERGYDPKSMLPSVADRYENEFRRGDICMPEMIANNGYTGGYTGGSRNARNGMRNGNGGMNRGRYNNRRGSRTPEMSIYGSDLGRHQDASFHADSVEAMTSEDDSDYVCFKSSDGKSFSSMSGNTGSNDVAMGAPASGTNTGLYNGNGMSWDDIKNYIEQKTDDAKQAIMSNPTVQQTAQNVATNPQVQQAKANLMANPQVQQARARLASGNGCSIM